MKIYWIILLLVMSATQANAATSIAILEFELNDLTLKPRIAAEIDRTANLKPLLETELNRAGYRIVSVSSDAQQKATSGFGYLFDHHDVAAELGKNAGADYVLVGRLHKPSFLFAYILGHLIRTQDGQLIGNYVAETKGGESKLTLKAIESLADMIDNDLENRYTPPPPERAGAH